MIPLTLTADRDGERVDAFLARSVPDLTRSAAQRLLEEGAVTLTARGRKEKLTRPGPGTGSSSPCPTRSPWTCCPRTSPWTWCMRTTM